MKMMRVRAIVISVALVGTVGFAAEPFLELTTVDGAPVLKVGGSVVKPVICNDKVTVPEDGVIRLGEGAQLKFVLPHAVNLHRDYTTLIEVKTRHMFPWTGQEAKDLNRKLDGTLAEKSSEDVSSRGLFMFRNGDKDVCRIWTCGGYVSIPGQRQIPWNRCVFPEEWHVFSACCAADEAYCVGMRDGIVLHSPFPQSAKQDLVFDTVSFGTRYGWDRNFQGDIRAVKVWNGRLDERQQRLEHAKSRSIAVELEDYAFTEAKANRLKFRLFNFSNQTQRGSFSWTLDGLADSKNYEIPSGECRDLDFEIKPTSPGVFRLRTNQEQSFEVCVIEKEPFVDRLPAGEPSFRLVDEIDCSQNLPYPRAGLKESTVLKDATGAYRETPAVARGAFSYRIDNIRNPRRYHVLEIEYPDNAKRAFSVHVYSADPANGTVVGGQTHSVGILTGGFHFNTGTMQKKRLYFVPYSDKAMVIVENRGPQHLIRRPGAVARLRVYEVEQDWLPKLPAAVNADREINVWDEDPAIDCVWFNNPSLEKDVGLDFWREKAARIVEYANFVGYNAWTMQVVDYGGDRNGSFYTLPTSQTAGLSGHVNGWCDVYAKTFERDRLKFFGRISPGYTGWCFWHDLAKGKLDLRGQRCGATGIDPTTPLAKELFLGIARHYRMKYADNAMFQGLEFDTRFFFKDGAANASACTELLKAFMAELRKGNDRLRVILSVSWTMWQRGNSRPDFDIEKNLLDIGCDVKAWKNIPGVVLLMDQDPEGEQSWGFDVRTSPDNRSQQAVFDPESAAFFEKNLATRGYNFFLHANFENFPGTKDYLPESVYPMGYWESKTNFPNFLSWCNPYPNTDEALQPWSSALANTDVKHFLTGWWNTPDVGVTEQFRAFYRQVRAIPDGDYRRINSPDDPVTIRVSGDNWYMVNRLQVEAEVRVPGIGDSPLRFAPSEVKVGRGSPEWSKARQSFDERVLDGFRELEVVLSAEAAHGSPELKDLSLRFKSCLDEKKVMRLRALVCDPLVEKALNDVRGYRHVTTFDAGTKSFDLAITSISRQPIVLQVSWVGSEQWTVEVDRSIVKTVRLNPGETKHVALPLAKWEPEYIYQGPVTLKITEGVGKSREYKYMVGGLSATKASAGKRLGDDPEMRGYKRIHLSEKTPEGEIVWEYGYQWREDGLFACAVVEDEDHYPAKLTGAYEDMIHRNDSLQFFANGGAKAEWNDNDFDNDDLEGLVGDTAEGVKTVVNLRPSAATGDVSSYFRREGNRSAYEIFIPKSLLPGVKFEKGFHLGFLLMVNSRFPAKGAAAAFSTTGKIFPYKRPGVWPDVVFR